MAPLVFSDDAVFCAWAAATGALSASIATAIDRSWVRSRRLRLEDYFTWFRVALMLICALLFQATNRLYAVLVIIPERRRRRGVQDAVGMVGTVERMLNDKTYVWHVGGCLFCLGFLMSSIALARRRAPPPPRAATGPRAVGDLVPLAEVLLFLVSLWVCVYGFPVAVLCYYMAATEA